MIKHPLFNIHSFIHSLEIDLNIEFPEETSVFIDQHKIDGIEDKLLKLLTDNLDKEDFVIFGTGVYGMLLTGYDKVNNSNYYLNGKQETRINKKLQFWPSGKDNPKWGRLIVFKNEETKVAFETTHGFGILS